MKIRSVQVWGTGVLLILLIWGLALLLGRCLGSLTPTADALSQWVEAQPVGEMDDSARREYLDEYARRLNRLSMEERREMRDDPVFERSFEEMTEKERLRFIDATLPQGMRQMMQALNEMDPEERKRLIERALRDLEKTDEEEIGRRMEDDEARRMVEVGLETYYEEASPETRLQLAPLLEEMQRRLQRSR